MQTGGHGLREGGGAGSDDAGELGAVKRLPHDRHVLKLGIGNVVGSRPGRSTASSARVNQSALLVHDDSLCPVGSKGREHDNCSGHDRAFGAVNLSCADIVGCASPRHPGFRPLSRRTCRVGAGMEGESVA